MSDHTNIKSTDVLIIGSGPIGATFARMISDALPKTKIVMIDLGPKLTKRAGMHVKNISDAVERESAQIKSQGPHQKAYPLTTVAERANAAKDGNLSLDMLARPGTHLVTDNITDLKKNQMPAASYSSNVGGMGAHWTCACPRPGNEEKIPFIPEQEYEFAFAKAEELLCVTQNAFAECAEGVAIQKVLGDVMNHQLSKNRQVQPMPLACKVDENGERYWVGSDIILGELAEPGYDKNFELKSETICRKLFTDGKNITGALIEHLPTKKIEEIKAKITIVACDALRTPQLLWASGIRPKALGHYLNEHPFVFCFVELNDELVEKSFAKKYDQSSRSEPTIGVFWVPFDAPNHPFHGQIMHMDVSPIKIETNQNPKHIVGLGWGCTKEIQYEDHIEFSETEKDYLGMPKLNLRFTLTENDKMQIEKVKSLQIKIAKAFGKIIQEGEQTLMPAGTSLHLQGTTRMGKINDGTSVCDSHSNVWGYSNLFVGGNGVIPMPTTSNPTLTSVAMAVRASKKIISLLENKSY
ncbi:MAG: GMC family oxidoreductase N-terminal domain-containing protein [Bacteroidetes bacterium]|nr:GMC family oxidoreductase N-terminal domain-containing protein [Bacteroidota bacterium]